MKNARFIGCVASFSHLLQLIAKECYFDEESITNIHKKIDRSAIHIFMSLLFRRSAIAIQ
jgi:hypothetical protein